MAIEKEAPITVAKVRRHDEKTMILRVGIGEGEVDGEKFDFSYSTSGDPCWYFSAEGRYYSVSMKALTEDVINFRKEVK